jgi:AcrR family transcriptional regulator
MPRQADPDLEKRVLDAAQKLWRGGGDKTLSMRALAKAARTNTPAIYRRFKDRKDILQALLLRARTKQVEAIQSARSLEEAIDLYIEFALHNPWEYELYYLQEHEQLRPAVSRSPEIGPGFQWLQQQLADRLGGSPDEHAPLGLALWGLAHGAGGRAASGVPGSHKSTGASGGEKTWFFPGTPRHWHPPSRLIDEY